MNYLIYFTKTINGTPHSVISPFRTFDLIDGSNNTAGSTTLNLRVSSTGDRNIEVGDKIWIWAATGAAAQLNLTINSSSTLASLYNVDSISYSAVSPKGLPIITCTKPAAITTAVASYNFADIGPVLIVKQSDSAVFEYLTDTYSLQYKNKADDSWVVPGNSINRNYLIEANVLISRFSHLEIDDINASTAVNVIKFREILRAGSIINLTNSTIINLVNSLLVADSLNRNASATESGHILNQFWTHPTLSINRAEYILKM